MNKASSTLLATAGVTVGLLGFALPAGAATTPASNTPSVTSVPNQSGGAPSDLGSNNQSGSKDGNRGGQDGKGGRGDYGGQDGKGGRGKDGRGDQRNPCPTKTHKPCPPKPCEWVWTKPCKDKHGHWGYAKAKHTYVCHPKPCPAKPKPCPTKTSKPCPTKGDKGHGHKHQRPVYSAVN